jgi:hypothetical protein
MSQTAESQNADFPVDPNFDPLDPDCLGDPYPLYARFRRKAPIFYAPKIDFWVVSRYEDMQNILKDPETLSNVRVHEPLLPLNFEALEKLKKGVRVKPTTSTAVPPDQHLEIDPNMSFRGPKELWAGKPPRKVPAYEPVRSR